MKLPLFNSFIRGIRRAIPVLILAALAAPRLLYAFPPAPFHRITGLVRDEYGQPVSTFGAYIVFEATNGVKVASAINPGMGPGINYEVQLPMDSMLSGKLYRPTALTPDIPFRITVWMNSVSYLPIEMAASFASLGQPAGLTHIDLTLGVDANGDGLPDAWQNLLVRMLGPGTKVGPQDSALGDGISNLSKYIAGLYAWDTNSSFRLAIVPRAGARPVVEFSAVSQHSYSLLSTTNLVDWTPMPFKVPSDLNTPDDLPRNSYFAPGTQTLQFDPQHSDAESGMAHFYKLQVQ